MSQLTGVKRTNSSDTSKLRKSKRRKTLLPDELHHKTMTGVVPLMSLQAHVMYTPDINVVNKIRRVIETGLKSQKQIAGENRLR
jgi:hypothetical protein